MLFNSYEFIFVFFPATFLLYFLFNRFHLFKPGQIWLIGASLFFYSCWNFSYVFLIIISILFNFLISNILLNNKKTNQNILFLSIGCCINIILLGYFKYTDFLLKNINETMGTDIGLLNISLPLGISFFTFQQIAFLVDCYRGEVKKIDLFEYFLFVSFFCQLIAGPIVKFKEMLPQFRDIKKKEIEYENIACGLFIFFFGLFKKVIIADTLSKVVNLGFDKPFMLDCMEAWLVTLSYTMQLYFDFSGYMDMASGAALMLNIHLPVNFMSPYLASNISEFWRRWHITLGRFFKDYLYIPLGGNRKSSRRTIINLLVTFLLCGIWHGAGWNFMIWGIVHGIAVVIHRQWVGLGHKIHPIISRVLTFMFVNFTWVIFRADNIASALEIYISMFSKNHHNHTNLATEMPAEFSFALVALATAFFIIFVSPSIEKIQEKFKPRLSYAFFIILSFVICFNLMEKESPFLYWQF